MQNKKIKELEKLIGNTPLVEITYKFKGKCKKAYFKLEWYNLTGSIKDRMVINVIKNAYATGQLNAGQGIVEATSGNTGISLSAIGSYLGNPITILMPEHMTEERKKIITDFGANLELVPKECGFLKCKEFSKELAIKEKAFETLQFENKNNELAHFKNTAEEIITSLSKINKIPDAIAVGVGTGGTLMGIGKKLKQINKNAKIFAIEPKESPVLKTGKKIGPHKLQGMNGDFIPKLIDKKLIDKIIDIGDADAISMANKIKKELGLGVGITSGANFLGAVLASENLPINSCVVSVFPDDNKKYLSNILNLNKELDDSVICQSIELLG